MSTRESLCVCPVSFRSEFRPWLLSFALLLLCIAIFLFRSHSTQLIPSFFSFQKFLVTGIVFASLVPTGSERSTHATHSSPAVHGQRPPHFPHIFCPAGWRLFCCNIIISQRANVNVRELVDRRSRHEVPRAFDFSSGTVQQC